MDNNIIQDLNAKLENLTEKLETMDDDIVSQYVEILNFYDAEFPDIKKDGITIDNISKTTIITYLKDKIIDDIKGSIYEEQILAKYRSKN